MVDMGEGFRSTAQPVTSLVLETLRVVDPEQYQELVFIADGRGWEL
jgi:hypothetical protein